MNYSCHLSPISTIWSPIVSGLWMRDCRSYNTSVPLKERTKEEQRCPIYPVLCYFRLLSRNISIISASPLQITFKFDLSSPDLLYVQSVLSRTLLLSGHFASACSLCISFWLEFLQAISVIIRVYLYCVRFGCIARSLLSIWQVFCTVHMKCDRCHVESC
jgi:hypothetical protein